MERTLKMTGALWLAALIAVAACAGRQPRVTIVPSQGEVSIVMTASDFSFEPNNIRVYGGKKLLLRIENVSHRTHNFTIKDPRGVVEQSASLPPQKTVTVEADLSGPGIYEFYCDKPFHAVFGMKGRIEAKP